MEFDERRVYSAVNANELEIGSKIYAADNLETLKALVERGGLCDVFLGLNDEEEEYTYVFVPEANDDTAFAYAYLIEPPTKL